MDILKEVSDFIGSKIKEELAKSQELTKLILSESDILYKGCLITGSYAKRHYGFELPHQPKDRDLVLIYNSFRDIYLLADSLMPKECRTGSWHSITVKKGEEFHFRKPIASFVLRNQFVEVFENVNNITWQDSGYVPLTELVKCAREWRRDKDLAFLKQIRSL